MSQPKHKGARHHFAQLIKDMADRGDFSPEMAKRLEEIEAGPNLYVLDGKTPRRAADILEWGRTFCGPEKFLARDAVGGVTVSTIFLGIASNIFGPPLLFETMVFGGQHDRAQNRYETYDEALAGHQWWLAKVTKSEGN
jgi:hypothetical protein